MARKWIQERVLMKCSVQNITTKCQVHLKSTLSHYTTGMDHSLLGLGVKKNLNINPFFLGIGQKWGLNFCSESEKKMIYIRNISWKVKVGGGSLSQKSRSTTELVYMSD